MRVQLHFIKEQMETKNETWRDVCQMAKGMSYAQRGIISEVIKLINLILLFLLQMAQVKEKHQQFVVSKPV